MHKALSVFRCIESETSLYDSQDGELKDDETLAAEMVTEKDTYTIVEHRGLLAVPD